MNEETRLNINPPKAAIIIASVVGVALVVYLGVLARNGLRQYDYIGRPADQLYTITIEGEGKVTAVPDIAQISLGLQTDKTTVTEAQRENTAKVNKIVSDLKELGIEGKDIKTDNYSVYPRYDWADGRQILRGYTVTQSLGIKIRNLDAIGTVLEKATANGANQIGGLNFTIDEPETLKQQAREKALEQAKQKAESLSKVAGVKLGRLVSFNENSSGGYPIYSRLDMLKGLSSAGEAAAPAPDIEPGSQDITVNVTVTYELL